MRLLLGSGGFRTPERIELLAQQMRNFFGNTRSILFIPYALHDHDGYVQELREKGLNAGYELDGIHCHGDVKQAIEDAEAIFVGGGNSFRLLNALYQFDLLNIIRERVRQGMPYMGVSAGSNLACPTIKTTNDMPIVQPPSFDALGLVPFQINPHYYSGHNFIKSNDEFQEHFGETRDDRIREFHEMNDTPVLGVWEAGVLRIENDEILLIGSPARIFRKGSDSEDIEPGARLDLRLTEIANPQE